MLAGGAAPQRGQLPLAGRPDLLPPLPVRRRLRHARRAGAEVLGGVLPRRRPRGPDRARRSTRRAPTRTRRVSEIFAERTREQWRAVRHRARLLPGAGARARRGAGLRARGRAGDGRRARPAGRRAAGASCSGCRSSSAARRPTRPGRPARRSASTPTSSSPRPATAPPRSQRCTRPAPSPDRRRRVRAVVPESMSADAERHAQDVRARRALGRQRGHDQALPARGAARIDDDVVRAPAATWPTTRRSSSSGSS